MVGVLKEVVHLASSCPRSRPPALASSRLMPGSKRAKRDDVGAFFVSSSLFFIYDGVWADVAKTR